MERRRVRKHWSRRGISLLIASLGLGCGLFLSASPANAAPISAFTGNTFLDDGAVDGTVNYAVFTKAAFLAGTPSALRAAFKNGLGSPDLDNSGGSSAGDLDLSGSGYVYLYEQTNNGRNTFVISALTASTGGTQITSWGYFSKWVFKDNFNAIVNATNNLGVDTLPPGGSGPRVWLTSVGFSALATAINPGRVVLTSSSVRETFSGTGLGTGKSASIMVFTGQSPTWFDAHIDDHGTSAYGPAPAPGPVPEPGTLLLLGSGLAGAVAWGTKFRRRSSGQAQPREGSVK